MLFVAGDSLLAPRELLLLSGRIHHEVPIRVILGLLLWHSFLLCLLSSLLLDILLCHEAASPESSRRLEVLLRAILACNLWLLLLLLLFLPGKILRRLVPAVVIVRLAELDLHVAAL